MLIASRAWSIAVTASLKRIAIHQVEGEVTAGSWPRWLTASGLVPGSSVVTAVSGTTGLMVAVPVEPVVGWDWARYRPSRTSH